MARVAHYAHVAVALALLAGLGSAKADGQEGRLSVAILALPSGDGRHTSKATRDLVQALTSALTAADFRVVVAGSPTAAPLEELAARANAAGVDVALGVRSLASSARCARLVSPGAASRPAQLQPGGEHAQLVANVKQLAAAMRYESSVRLAGSLVALGQWCDPQAGEAEAYVLQAVAAPTVVLSLPPREQEEIVRRLPAVMQGWAASERAGK